MHLMLVLALSAAGAAQDHQHHAAPELGEVSFETSCEKEAEAQFKEGLGWLHSFEYEQAARTFAAAAEKDPDCGIAHWGVAMSHFHPLWAPPSQAELAKGRAALAMARKATGSTDREQAYFAAMEAFYGEADRLDHKVRVLSYSALMGELHRRHPEDQEAAVFYALSLIAAGTMDADPGFEKEHEAGAILNAVLERAPDHPGVAHYLIHSFDYPPLAEMALPAARRYATIAPASPHAQHMPSHIFVRLGHWDETIASNLASEAAARDFAKAQGLPDSSSERLHAMDYLAYGYLQTGQDTKAEQVLADLKAIRRADPPVFSVAYAATAIPARLVLERRRWKEAAKFTLPDTVRNLAPLENFQWAAAHEHFTRAIGAARTGLANQAADEVARLKAIEDALVVPAGTYDWRTQVAIERGIAEAWLARAEGRDDEALQRMRAVADLDDATEKHPVTPGAIIPAREQLGELLFELGRPAEALAHYEASLARAPRRLAGLYGAARSAKGAGQQAKARAYFSQLVEVAGRADAGRTELREARTFIAQH